MKKYTDYVLVSPSHIVHCLNANTQYIPITISMSCTSTIISNRLFEMCLQNTVKYVLKLTLLLPLILDKLLLNIVERDYVNRSRI